jgi:lipopolysaccharide/colanic/teichoic acid biosynthesis glycosyltransferase
MSKSRQLLPVLEFTICAANFTIATALYSAFDFVWLLTPESVVGVLLAGLVFWICMQFYRSNDARSPWVVSIEQTAIGIGFILILEAVVSYANLADPTPLPIVLTGSVLSGGMIGLIRGWVPGFAAIESRVLMVGFGSIGETLAGSFGPSVIGVIERDPSQVPPGIPFLGKFSQLSEVVAAARPSRIIVSLNDWAARIPPRLLLQARLSGVTVEEAAAVYEKLYLRVSAQSVSPAGLLLSPAFRPNRPIMAVQAVYSNLIGLLLLVTLSPVLVVVGLLARQAAGPGPVFDRVECEGFQGIPFVRLRFRTRRTKSGELSWVGRTISRLRLTNLPQLINIVRGEMALFGPPAVRREFAALLRELIPFYAHRFTVKPGMLGWAQTQAAPKKGVPEETLQLEYDLYYLKECSPSLDFEILLRRVLQTRRAPRGGV